MYSTLLLMYVKDKTCLLENLIIFTNYLFVSARMLQFPIITILSSRSLLVVMTSEQPAKLKIASKYFGRSLHFSKECSRSVKEVYVG